MTHEEEMKLKKHLENICRKYIKEFESKYYYQSNVLFISYQKRKDIFAKSDSFKIFGNFNDRLFNFETYSDRFDSIKSVFNLLNEINFACGIQYFYCYKENSEIKDYYTIGNFKIGHNFYLDKDK